MDEVARVRRLAQAVPGLEDRSSAAQVSLAGADGKAAAWTFLRREQPRKPRVPEPSILAVRCDVARKAMLIEAAGDRFFEDDHYRGYPAVLVRLAAIDDAELQALLAAASAPPSAKSPRKRSR